MSHQWQWADALCKAQGWLLHTNRNTKNVEIRQGDVAIHMAVHNGLWEHIPSHCLTFYEVFSHLYRRVVEENAMTEELFLKHLRIDAV